MDLEWRRSINWLHGNILHRYTSSRFPFSASLGFKVKGLQLFLALFPFFLEISQFAGARGTISSVRVEVK